MIQKLAKKAAKGILPGGCLPPYLQPAAVRKMIARKLTPAGSSVLGVDALNLTRTRKPGVWSFDGIITRQPYVGPHKMPLGGKRLSINGVFDAVKQEFLRYNEEVLGFLRSKAPK
jgi:hypothetical protein